jgi:Kef-type K+ transport system membrane component KefB
LFTLFAFVGIVFALKTIWGFDTHLGAATGLLGFLLLASYLAGGTARQISLPQITGYLVIGILVGPSVLGIIPREVVVDFRFVNGVALALIALSAGGELRIDSIRKRLKSIALITTSQIVLVFAVVTLFVFLARDLVGFLEGQPTRVALAVALIFGLVAVAKSPATTIAVITEEKAGGILTDTVLGITVLKDVIILILIAVVIPLAVTIVDPASGFDLSEVAAMLVEILGSLAVGLALGWGIRWYLRKIGAHPILFVLGVAFGSVVLGEHFHLESILVAMAAGFFVQNFSDRGHHLLEALEVNSLPLYALFFAVAGADLDILVLRDVWGIAAVIIGARVLALIGSTYLGAVVSGDPPVIRSTAWMGFLAQAGITLGLANIVRERFPVWGGEVATVIVAMIAVNQLIGPPLFRYSLIRAKESGHWHYRSRA